MIGHASDVSGVPERLAYGEVTLRFVSFVPAAPSEGLVEYYHFRILDADGSDVGHINFRPRDTKHVQFVAGHIGFEVVERFRGHRYALQACYAIAPFVRSVAAAVIITCDPDNIPSQRTIERLGATFIDEVAVPPDDPGFRRGARIKRRYRWTLPAA